jgi:F0F1-type ATP synthase membrane subunit c/vacuolar-type H+-ATPase subunit K
MSLGIDESKAKDVEQDRKADASYRTLRIIWLAILVLVIAVFVVTRFIQPTPEADKILFWILLAVGLGQLGASFLLKQKMLTQAITERKPELARGAYITAFALCESIGILGLIVYLSTGVEYYYFFFVLSGFGILLHKPQRDDLLAAVAGRGIWEARKND